MLFIKSEFQKQEIWLPEQLSWVLKLLALSNLFLNMTHCKGASIPRSLLTVKCEEKLILILHLLPVTSYLPFDRFVLVISCFGGGAIWDNLPEPIFENFEIAPGR